LIFLPSGTMVRAVKAAEIIAEIKGLPPEGLAEVSAFMLQIEQEDPAFQVALHRLQQSDTGQVVSRPYEEVLASVRTALDRARE
jgi:hypothetical protein